MKEFFLVLFKFIRNWPKAKLYLAYRIQYWDSAGIPMVHYSIAKKDKKTLSRYKRNGASVKRKLICRIL